MLEKDIHITIVGRPNTSDFHGAIVKGFCFDTYKNKRYYYSFYDRKTKSVCSADKQQSIINKAKAFKRKNLLAHKRYLAEQCHSDFLNVSTVSGSIRASLGLPGITLAISLNIAHQPLRFLKNKTSKDTTVITSYKNFVSKLKVTHKTLATSLGYKHTPKSWSKMIPTKIQYLELIELMVSRANHALTEVSLDVVAERVVSSSMGRPSWLVPYPGLNVKVIPMKGSDKFYLNCVAMASKSTGERKSKSYGVYTYSEFVDAWPKLIDSYKRLRPEIEVKDVPTPSLCQFDQLWDVAIDQYSYAYSKSEILFGRESR